MKQLLLLAAALFLGAPALAWQATVTGVHDGDSVNVVSANGTAENIRLYGIDAPETRQPHGQQARRGLSRLVGRGAVDIEPLDRDKYGRCVALLRLPDGLLVNEAQVAAGNAWVYVQYCRQQPLCARLAGLEANARAERRGLWAGEEPEPPWEWRRENKSEEWHLAPLRAIKAVVRAVRRVLP